MHVRLFCLIIHMTGNYVFKMSKEFHVFRSTINTRFLGNEQSLFVN